MKQMDTGIFQQSRNGLNLDIILLHHLRYKTPIKWFGLPVTETKTEEATWQAPWWEDPDHSWQVILILVVLVC